MLSATTVSRQEVVSDSDEANGQMGKWANVPGYSGLHTTLIFGAGKTRGFDALHHAGEI